MAGESQRRTISQLNVGGTLRHLAHGRVALLRILSRHAANSPDEASRLGTDRACACARAGVNIVGIDPRNECLTSS
ncbi:hypothetical protein BQ8794_140244 [Mesorhizobium prunaredense]|uniref:Uncharacterized protein n=1 Tax=Mesorhizobium prunaredense TaxID=1631249 RepID=A0A1R3V2M5_9HYPH|nr:hypothetical protein BQ8794_140244 [Mesorhizobium prunaredense]